MNFIKYIKKKIKYRFSKYIMTIISEYEKHNFVYNSTIHAPSRVGKRVYLNNVTVGSYSYISQNSVLSYTHVGKFCSIGPNCMIGWGIHPLNGISTSPMFYSTKKQNGMTLSQTDKIDERKLINIGNDVFIGMNAIVLDGITIGDGAVIGAGAVVSKDIPPYAIAVGCPIKIIGYRFEPPIIEKLLVTKWWDSDDDTLRQIEKQFFHVDDFLADKIK